MFINSVEAVQTEIDRLTPIYAQARRVLAQTQDEVRGIEGTFPATSGEVNAWVDSVATRAARLEAANVLVDRLNRGIEDLRRKKKGMIDNIAEQETQALYVEKAQLEDLLARTAWTINHPAAQKRLREIQTQLRVSKYGL